MRSGNVVSIQAHDSAELGSSVVFRSRFFSARGGVLVYGSDVVQGSCCCASALVSFFASEDSSPFVILYRKRYFRLSLFPSPSSIGANAGKNTVWKPQHLGATSLIHPFSCHVLVRLRFAILRHVFCYGQEELLRLGRGIHGLVIATLIGGVPVAEQSKALAGGCHVAVGTPGRVRFLMKKGLLRPHSAKTLVLDSADWLMAAVFQVGEIMGDKRIKTPGPRGG